MSARQLRFEVWIRALRPVSEAPLGPTTDSARRTSPAAGAPCANIVTPGPGLRRLTRPGGRSPHAKRLTPQGRGLQSP